jgi:hypothetical protein
VVKKMSGSPFKIGHEKFRARYADEESSTFVRNMAEVLRQHPDLKPAVQKSVVSALNKRAVFCCRW